QKYHEECQTIRRRFQDITARFRALCLEGRGLEQESLPLKEATADFRSMLIELKKSLPNFQGNDQQQAEMAYKHLAAAFAVYRDAMADLAKGLNPGVVARLNVVVLMIQQAAEMLGAEPPPRALSTIAYDAKTKLYVLFGGDHLDYLTNDTWVFDPARKK